MTATTASPAQWRGHDLGTRTIAYDERDAILYALAVGASATDLDLVFEERLRVLPTFALTLAQWAPDALGALGAFDTRTALHGSQSLEVLAPLPRSGEITMSARVGEVWDKGRAAVFEVVVESEYFVATWSLFAPGAGGFGGERGPSAPAAPDEQADTIGTLTTHADQAALYRLTGDRHHIHIDPAAAARIGQPRPILHGLCTLAAATLPLADMLGAHPADLRTLFGRFAAPVFPGDTAQVRSWGDTTDARFDVVTQAGAVLSGGRAAFA
ncbi:dehydrogenase [Rhodococcus rhodochrous]|uniref:MaoC/PaaZ C-terminal domain-containing protein n=1 Tax=Rhodococcus TaxID=1827 RepID=UPI000750F633|nr:MULTISPECIES: MaoC/PaaZ C-terminal domain-containing protein [Rhodococcus]MDC3725842.1 MaoC family dehydratase N-terminal domain-containing protein [Rhodococcus sp. Rp3]MDJ0399311.1 MaoC/PaaZ C-terminal domain-containing protein [Rhodococcus rhodochrous]MDO1484389.1 enoyl-CoA hydratase [Rhodococcus rhodochrous]WSE23274.1 MaoC/PaaZ C-terminal domain-containing protein [Rhodococcus sp. PD04]SNV11534.1 dehydrogenase [Rhodococcus rhodochrous]